jgi:hypothetical protein
MDMPVLMQLNCQKLRSSVALQVPTLRLVPPAELPPTGVTS